MITKPTFLIDEQKCRRNIQRILQKAQKSHTNFRPHFKTHQSLEIGRWFKEYGVDKITVSSVTMAEYFAEEWDDITIAFPVNILEIDSINQLAKNIKLNLIVESEESAKFLVEKIEFETGFFIKIDVGYHRTGISPKNFELIDKIIEISNESKKLHFKGFLTHAGHSYKARSFYEIKAIHEKSIKRIQPLKDHYKKIYPELIISVGDTPTCSIIDDFSMFDEIRPGNFVFYDLSQEQIGSCNIEQIAGVLACPIVAIHKNRNEIVIYGGGVHLSKERMEDDEYGTIYGRIVEQNDASWGEPIPNMYVKNLSQEHGIISVTDEEISRYKVGDLLYILPVHSCMTANLMDYYQTLDGKIIPRL